MKKTLLALAVAGAAVSAQADTTLSGHVNYVIGDFEDFNGNEDIDIHTASTSESRFRILFDKEHNGVTYGIREEFGLGEPGRANALNKRFNEFYLKGGFGKLSLGQGSSAGDGASEEDFSGTYLLFGDLSSWNLGSGLGATPDTVEVVGGVPTVVAGSPAQEGASFAAANSRDIGRQERIRYDLPKLGPVAIAASLNEGDDVNLAARVKQGGFAAHVAIVSAEADDSDVVTGSVAAKIAGFTGALQLYTSENGGDDLEQTRVVVGYNPGPFSISVDLQQTETDSDSVDIETTGLNFVYRPTKGVELYAGLRNVDDSVADIDGDGFLLGGRVKF